MDIGVGLAGEEDEGTEAVEDEAVDSTAAVLLVSRIRTGRGVVDRSLSRDLVLSAHHAYLSRF